MESAPENLWGRSPVIRLDHAFGFSPDGKWLISGGPIHALWDLDAMTEQRR